MWDPLKQLCLPQPAIGSGFTAREAARRKLINAEFGVKMSVINAFIMLPVFIYACLTVVSVLTGLRKGRPCFGNVH